MSKEKTENKVKSVKDRVLEYERFKKSVVEYLSKRDNPDKVFMYVGEKGYSYTSLIDAINNSTKDGLDTISNTFILTLDLLVRDNQELKKKCSLLAENAQLKDTLKEAIELFYEHEDGYMYLNIHDWIAKAKQLLNKNGMKTESEG